MSLFCTAYPRVKILNNIHNTIAAAKCPRSTTWIKLLTAVNEIIIVRWIKLVFLFILKQVHYLSQSFVVMCHAVLIIPKTCETRQTCRFLWMLFSNWIKLHSVHSALDFERFRDDGFVFQNSNEPVPKCTCSLNACLHLESTINL